MSKIIVPQEQQDAIIDLYVNKYYGLGRIKNTLNLPFSLSVIQRVLKENNIHIRTFEEAKVGSPRIEVPQELQNQIIALYEQGYGLDRIVESLKLTFSFDKVRSILIDNGVHIRNVKESAYVKLMPDLRKYPINDNYCLESHNGAWLLGFIAADGYLPTTKGAKNKIVITLQRADEDILHMIAQEIKYMGPIYQYNQKLNDKEYPVSSLSFTSKKLREQIEKYGIKNNKTFEFNQIPDLPNEYKIDFIRGFFDGDGSIYESNRRIGSSFSSASFNLLDEIQQFLQQNFDIKGRNISGTNRKHIIYDLRYHKEDTYKLGIAFYNNDHIALPRKKKKFFELYSKKITPTSLNTPKE